MTFFAIEKSLMQLNQGFRTRKICLSAIANSASKSEVRSRGLTPLAKTMCPCQKADY
ncbi:hypothetical protein [Anabaena sp. UHCC 0399]|uniref:hypothetical protein n=1 Tax=Anabaena sp. UHCC 0399 TaxID=3110238 RepID=UPI002B217678|nr:hypothetical protein [Anabaena sp. UHCC 0399]MEA5566671.1 hypothetical protein [Anabaena sp. UHCC 0399]